MTYAEMILPEFEQEMASTRKVLERVPDDKFEWKSHPKSHTMGWNASHLAEIPGWVAGTIAADEWDLSPPGGEPYRTPALTTRDEVLKTFDANVAAAKKALAEVKEEAMGKMWSLKQAGETIVAMPKRDVIRTWVINHTIHHRAHLCAYLRLNDIPVPGMYGPSGDE